MNDINDLIKLAESGDASAQLDLGLCYQEGKGVEKNYEIAVEYFKKAAAQGFVFAYCFLGLCYEIGRGVKQSDEIAFEYYKKQQTEEMLVHKKNWVIFIKQEEE